MRDANRRFAEALAAGDVAAALDADERYLTGSRWWPWATARLRRSWSSSEPLVRRAELLRFSGDGRASVERHEQLIELLAAGDAEGAASVNFDIWHNPVRRRRRRPAVAHSNSAVSRRTDRDSWH